MAMSKKILGSQLIGPRGVSFDFSAALSTFTVAMAKRLAPTQPFAAGPIVQGQWDSTYPDIISHAVGTAISGNFCPTIDTTQGDIVFWVTPEWSGGDNLKHVFRQWSANGAIYKDTDNKLYLSVASGKNVSVDISAWVAGATYCISARWDSQNTLDGTNYCCISIDDVHTFGCAAYTPEAPQATQYIGSDGTTYPANALISGMTCYRRPLWDGSRGCNAGNGDEINLAWAASAGKDQTEITGSFDVTACTPTNATVGALDTTGEMWSHPHSSGLLGTGGIDGLMFSTAWANWTAVGTGDTPDVVPVAQRIYGQGYIFTSHAAGDGYMYTKTVTAGDNWVIRGLAHSDGTSQPVLELWDETNNLAIGKLTGTTTSTRTAPDVFIFTGQSPAGCISLSVRCLNAVNSGVTYWHQVELLTNAYANPSFNGTPADPYVPTGWTVAPATAGYTAQETVDLHSSGVALAFTAVNASRDIHKTVTSTTVGTFYSEGFWAKKLSGGATDFSFNHRNSLSDACWQILTTSGYHTVYITSATWAHYKSVVRGISSATHQRYFAVEAWASGIVDDFYTFALTPVTLTIVPATLINSTETTGIRVDGRDTLTQPITNLSATSGTIRFKFTPRHSAANFAKLGNLTPVLFEAYGAAAFYIILDASAANTMRLRYKEAAAAERSGTWDCTGAIVAGTTYTGQIDYTASQMTLKVNGAVVITIAQVVNFSTALATAYYLADQAGTQQVDATVSAP